MVPPGSTISTAKTLRRLLAGTCLVALGIPHAAFAQPSSAPGSEAPAPSPATQSGGSVDKPENNSDLGVITVTARFVKENIQDTPIAITAQSNDQLKAANVTQVSQLGAVVPNLQTVPGDSQSAGTPRISLRGVQQGATSSLAVPPAVAIYTDDIYHGTTAGSELDFTDVASVEINRGPQSTLSGNASIAGSIRIYTVDPKGDGSGFLSLGYGSRNHMEASGAIDIGLSPTLAIRASGHYNGQTGYGNRLDFGCEMTKLGTPALAGTLPTLLSAASNNCVIGHTGGGKSGVGQIKLRWQPTSDIDLILTARHREEDLEETPEVALNYGGALGNAGICVGPVAGYPNGINVPAGGCKAGGANQLYYLASYAAYGVLPDNRFVPPVRGAGIYDTYGTNCRPQLNTSLVVGTQSFPANYPVGICYPASKAADSTILSGKLHVNLTPNLHMTAIVGHTRYGNEFTQDGDQSPLGTVISHFHNIDKQWSEELRFDGRLLDNKLQWVVGGFNVKLDGYQNNLISFTNVYQLSSVHGVNKSTSGFVHLDYSLIDRWRISGGGRYTHTDIAITIDNPQAVSVLTASHAVQNRWDWLISTDYKITPDVLAYASAASGSRPPGLTTIVNTPRQLQATSDEELISYEAGVKVEAFDRKLRMNLTGFYEDYKKLATSATGTECRNQPGAVATWFNVAQNDPAALTAAFCGQFPGTPTPITFFQNVGIPAKIKGFEWEITALPLPGLRIDWSGGYNKFTSGITTPKTPGYLWPGNHRQPEWNQHANVSYDIETGIGTFTPRLDWNWQSQQDYDTTPQNNPPGAVFIIPAYSLWNAQLAYKAPDGKWTAVLAVNNLTNKWYHYQLFRGSVDDQTRVGPPREFMVTVRRTF